MPVTADYAWVPMPLFRWLKKQEVMRRAESLLSECCQRLDLPEKSFDRSAREWLVRRRWPEETSEMRRIVYAAALMAPGETVQAVHFPPRGRLDHEAFVDANFEEMALADLVRQKVDHFFARVGDVEVTDVHRAVTAQVERALIDGALAWSRGNQLKAAYALGLSRNTLRRKMRELDITLEARSS